MAYDTTQLKVEEIRRILIDEHGLSEEMVGQTKGKSALVELLNKTEQELSGVDNVSFGENEETGDFEAVNENIKSSGTEEIDENQEVPIIGDSGWHEYVMSNFTEDEVLFGNPTVDGMRRVTELLIGPIDSIETTVLQCPDLANERRATVKVKIHVFENGSYDGVADAYWGNCDKTYRNYPTSVAETRAEGRALKRILRLKKVNAAEEIGVTSDHDDSVNEDDVENGLITSTQLQFLDIMCNTNRLNINVKKLVEYHKLSNDVKKLTHKDALMLNEKLSNYQGKVETIPEEIVGYDSTWRNNGN